MDELVHMVYSFTKSYPKEEIYGVTSQIRRAALSVILNFIEGYARNRTLVFINFLQMSYGSLKETNYLLSFSLKEGYLSEMDYGRAYKLADEIGAMIWQTIKSLKNKSS